MAKAPTIAAGTASSNDSFTVTEDQLSSGAIFFDVLSNDPRRTTLHSLDNGVVGDLVIEDQPNVTEQSSLGNSIWITSDGRVGFNAGLNGNYQSLAAGETINDSFLYAFKQSNGALVWQSVQITITGVNDAPVAQADTGLAIEDAVTTGSVASNDSDIDHGAVLQYSATGPLPAGLAMASDGSWTFDGSDPSYQALRAGEMIQLAVAYTVTDEHGATSASTLLLTLTGTNDAPLVNGAVRGAATEGGAVSTLQALANASDVDAGATLSVVGLPAELPPGVSYDAATRSFSLDPANSAYDSLAEGETLTVSVNYGVSDGTATTAASVSWTVTGTNDAPVAHPAEATVAEDGTIAGSVVATDPDAGSSHVYEPYYGGVDGFAMSADGSWTFDASQPEYQSLGEGESREVVVDYVVTDDHGEFSVSQLTITVTGTNDGPTASAATATVSEDGIVSGSLVVSDPDANASLTVEPPHSGIAGLEMDSDGNWTFDANQAEYQSLALGESLDVVINYDVADAEGAYAYSTLTVTIEGANDAPVTTSQWAEAVEGETTTGSLIALDQDNGAALTFAVDGEGPAGFTLNTDGSWSFDGANASYDSLTAGEVRLVEVPFTVTDEHGASSSSFMTIALTGTNDAPVVTGVVTGAATEDGASLALDAMANAGDVDGATSLSVVDVPAELPAGVSFDAASHSFTLDPTHAAYQSLAAGATATVSVNYGISDGSATTPASVSWTVTGINDAPALTGTPTVLPNGTEDTSFSFTPQQLLAGWTDAEGSALQITNLTVDRGTLFTKPDGSWYVQPSFDYNGPITLSYQVSDGIASTAATLTVNIAPVNDAPRYNTSVSLPTQTEDTNFTLTQQQLLNGWTDPEGAAMTVTSVTFNRGTVTANGDGSFTFQPNADYNGSATAFVTVSDGQLTRTQQVFFTIAPVADPARISGPTSGTVTEDVQSRATGNLNSIEPDNAADNDKWIAQTTRASDNGYGTYFVSSAGVWTYDVNNTNAAVNALNAGETLTDTFTIRTVDGTAQLITIIINGTTDYSPPPISTAADENDFDLVRADQEKPSTLYHYSATAADDLVDGSVSFDIVDGHGGADTLYGHGGGDTLYGEIDYPSRAQLVGVTGNDLLYGQSGNDYLYGNGGNDTLYGGSGVDYLYGDDNAAASPAAGNDTLYGGSGDDRLYGEGGDDILVGGTGADMITGGTGADRFVYTNGADTGDWILDFQRGTDLLDLSALGLSSSDFVGALSARGAVGAGQVGYWVQSGTTELYLYVDTDGVAGADLEIHISGNSQLGSPDIFWG